MLTSFILPVETERLIIRNWRENDRDLFFEVNSHDEVMEWFAFRRSRAESDAFMARLIAAIDTAGFGFTAIERKADGACIGFCGISELVMPGIFAPGTVEIGWRISRPCWGHGYVTEAARALAQLAYTRLHLREIIAIAVPENRRSIAVMDRLGMLRDPSGDFIHPSVPSTHPKLQRHGVWRLSQARWKLLKRA